MTDKQTTKTEGQHPTAVWRNGGCSASYDSFVVGSSAVLRLNFCAKNPPLRQAAKRCRQCSDTIKMSPHPDNFKPCLHLLLFLQDGLLFLHPANG
jgi:hypothetical protein